MEVKAIFDNKLFLDLSEAVKANKPVYAKVQVCRVENDIKFVCGENTFVIDPLQLYALIGLLFGEKFTQEAKK